MLDLLRENQTALQEMRGTCEQLVFESSQCLKILDPKRGDKELVKAVAVEVAKLSRGQPACRSFLRAW